MEPTANNNDDDDDERNRLHDAVAIGREKKTFFSFLSGTQKTGEEEVVAVAAV